MSATTLASLARGVAFAATIATLPAAAFATPVFSPNQDPFPAASIVTLTPGFGTVFGYVPEITLTDFVQSGFSYNATTKTEYFTYSADFRNVFQTSATDTTPLGSFVGTTSDFSVQIKNRTSLAQPGTFDAVITAATFFGNVLDVHGNPTGHTLATGITGPANGSVNSGSITVVDGQFGLYVSSNFSVPGGYQPDPTPGTTPTFTPTPPLTGTLSPVPAPAGAALLPVALIGLAAVRRRVAA